MPTTRTVKTYDFKYETRVWRSEVAETLRQKKQVRTEYTINPASGQIVETIETTWEFQSAKAERTNQLPDPPGGGTFLYIDGSYRANAAYIFQKTRIKTTLYEAYGDTSYRLTIEDRDVLNNVVVRSTSIIDGKAPLAPTVGSALTTLIQQPITGILDDTCGDYVPSTTVLDGAYLEDSSDAAKAARRKRQRDTAIVRRVKHGANPLMKIGQTIRLADQKRTLDARHILVGKTLEMREDGGADETLEMEFWTT